MRATWEALHVGLERSVRSLQAAQVFQQAKQQCPVLDGFDEPMKLLAHLTSKAGDLDQKDRILGSLVTLVQERQRLADLFDGTPVVLAIDRDGSLRAEVPLRFCFEPAGMRSRMRSIAISSCGASRTRARCPHAWSPSAAGPTAWRC
jgi:hypothetical protein